MRPLHTAPPTRRTGAVVALAACCSVALAACGSSGPPTVLRRAPEPAVAPSTVAAPAGSVVPLAGTPEGVVADVVTRSLAVATRDPDAVTILDLDSGRPRATVPLPGAARHLALAAGGVVLAPDEETDHLHRIDLATGRLLDSVVTGRQPHDAAALADCTIVVGDELADTAHVIPPTGPALVVRAPVQPGGVAATADGAAACAVGVRGRQIACYRADGTEIGRAAAGAGPTHAVTGPPRQGGGVVFVADTDGDAILTVVVTTSAVRVGRRTKVGRAPYGMAYDRARDRLWVASSATNTVEVREGPDLRLVATRATVQQPNAVAIDERDGSAWIASATLAGGLEHVVP